MKIVNIKLLFLIGNNLIRLLACPLNWSIDLSNEAEIVPLSCILNVCCLLLEPSYIVCQSIVHACSSVGGSDDDDNDDGDENTFSSQCCHPPRTSPSADSIRWWKCHIDLATV